MTTITLEIINLNFLDLFFLKKTGSYLSANINNKRGGPCQTTSAWASPNAVIFAGIAIPNMVERTSRKDARTFEKPIFSHLKLPFIIYNPWKQPAITWFYVRC